MSGRVLLVRPFCLSPPGWILFSFCLLVVLVLVGWIVGFSSLLNFFFSLSCTLGFYLSFSFLPFFFNSFDDLIFLFFLNFKWLMVLSLFSFFFTFFRTKFLHLFLSSLVLSWWVACWKLFCSLCSVLAVGIGGDGGVVP